jgi:hypothetical protein
MPRVHDTQGTDHRHATGAADEQPLFASEPAGHRERLGVGDALVPVDEGRVEGRGPEVLTDALDVVAVDVVTRVDRALGVDPDDAHRRPGDLAEVPAGAGDRAARADAGDEVGEPPLGVAPDLGTGGLVVAARTVRVGVLVGLEGAGDLAHQAVGDAVIRVRVVGLDIRGGHDDLRTVRPQHRPLVLGDLVGHDEDAAVPALLRDEGEADAGVAAGGLDDHSPGLQQAVALGGVDDVRSDAVFGRAAGVELLDLRENRGGDAVGDAGETDKGGVADEVGDALGVTHDGVLEVGAPGAGAADGVVEKERGGVQRQQRQVSTPSAYPRSWRHDTAPRNSSKLWAGRPVTRSTSPETAA